MNPWVFTQRNNLRTGDRLITEKGPLSRHHAIFVQIPGGVPLVAENQAGKGVQYITLEEFLLRTRQGKIWIQKFEGTETDRGNIIPQIDALIGTAYNLVNFNCEHFANLIQKKVSISQQVAAAVAGAVIIGIGLLAFGGKRK
jgi:hypothetical protein